MSDAWTLSLIGLLGACLGVANTAGLWWTVRLVPRVRRPGLLLLSSFVVRTGLALGVVVLVAGDRADRLGVGVACFLVARLAAVRVVGVPPARSGAGS